MLRTSGHEEQHADNTIDEGQDRGAATSAAPEHAVKSQSMVPANEDAANNNGARVELLSADHELELSTLKDITPHPETAPEEAAKPGLLKRFFNKRALGDLATGMAIGGAARYGVILLGTGGLAVGSAGFGVMAAAGVAAGVARTAWAIHKDRKAYEAKTGESISFWQWATKQELDENGNLARDENNKVILDNKKKYMIALGASTALATLGSAFATYAVPQIAEWAAPVLDRLMKSEPVAAIGGFLAGAWKNIMGDNTLPVATPASKTDPETIKRGMEAYEKMMDDIRQQNHTLSPDAIQRRIEDAHDAVKGAVPVTPTTPVLSVADRVSLLADKADLSQRWQGIVARAVDGNAQAQKDVASALLNGTHGFDKNPAEAAALYRAAADAGNAQAKADMAYMQFHGLGGIKADTKAALESLREQAAGNKYARAVLGNLTGEGAVKKSASSAIQRAVETAADPVTPAANLADVTPAIVPAIDGQIPANAELNITWTRSVNGILEGTVENAPEWLKDGMRIDGIDYAHVPKLVP